MDGFRSACFILLAFGLSTFGIAASADFLLEPYGGGQFSGTNSAASGSSYTSFLYGGRAGMEFSGFSFGGEYLADHNVDLKVGGPNKWGSDSTDLTMTDTNYGAFLGYQLTNAVRLIATYFISSQSHLVHTTPTSTDTDETLSGYGYKGELDVHLARYLNLGVAYYYMVYSKSRDNQTATTSSNVPVDNSHAVMALVTIPLEF
jgi:hypothetical protein